jgi:WD40 repeat protein
MSLIILSSTAVVGQTDLTVINELDVSPNGFLTAIARSNGEVSLLDNITGNVSILNVASGDITSTAMALAWNSSSTFLASGNLQGNIKIWDVSTLQLTNEIINYSGTVVDLNWSTTNNYVLAVYEQEDIILWDVDTGNQVASARLGTNLAGDLHLNGTTVVVGTLGGIHIINIMTNNEIRFIETGNFEGPLALNSTGDQIFAYSEVPGLNASQPVALNIWDTNMGNLIHSLITPSNIPLGAVLELGWSSDDQYVFTGTLNGFINVWNASTGEYINSIQDDSEIFALDLLDNTTFVFAGNPISGQVVETIPIPPLCNTTILTASTSNLISEIENANILGLPHTICLEAGTYTLDAPITSDITLHGLGAGAEISGSLQVSGAGRLTLRNVTVTP